MSGKTAKAERKAQTEEIKKYALSPEELKNFKRIASTIGFHETSIQGLETLLKINQAGVEVKHNVLEKKEGYETKTRIDLDAGFLLVKYIKKEEPAEEQAPEEKSN